MVVLWRTICKILNAELSERRRRHAIGNQRTFFFKAHSVDLPKKEHCNKYNVDRFHIDGTKVYPVGHEAQHVKDNHRQSGKWS